MRIRIAPDTVFGSSHSLAFPRVANESLSPLPKAFGETLHGSNHITAPLYKKDRKFKPWFDIERGFLSFSLFLDFEPGARGILAQDGGYLTLHEGPWYLAVRQRAFLTARTINLKQKTRTKTVNAVDKIFGKGTKMRNILLDTHLRAGTLSLYAVSTAREAELVMRHAGALHEVRVLQTFLA